MVVTDQFIFSYSRPVFVSMARMAKHIKRVLIWKVWTSCEVYLAAAWCARLYFCLFRSLSCHSTSTVALTRFVIAAAVWQCLSSRWTLVSDGPSVILAAVRTASSGSTRELAPRTTSWPSSRIRNGSPSSRCPPGLALRRFCECLSSWFCFSECFRL